MGVSIYKREEKDGEGSRQKIQQRPEEKQERRETNIPVELHIEEYTSLISSLIRVTTTEALNMGLNGSLVEGSNRWKKGKRATGEESGFNMLATYVQVDNGLVLRLRY